MNAAIAFQLKFWEWGCFSFSADLRGRLVFRKGCQTFFYSEKRMIISWPSLFLHRAIKQGIALVLIYLSRRYNNQLLLNNNLLLMTMEFETLPVTQGNLSVRSRGVFSLLFPYIQLIMNTIWYVESLQGIALRRPVIPCPFTTNEF